jgi:hypothetical protein
VHLPNKAGASYSLVNRSTSGIATLIAIALDRAIRGGSRFIHDALRVATGFRFRCRAITFRWPKRPRTAC